MVLHQPSFVMLPVNVTGEWYSDRGYQVLIKLETALSRPVRALGLIITGVTALIMLIASSVTAAVSLSQSVQTATYVNELSKNVSIALDTQDLIDQKLNAKIDALYEMVFWMGDEVQALKVKTRLSSHADYTWICVTAKQYNQSKTPWEKIKKHLLGIWHHENVTLDLVQFHKEVLTLQKASPLNTDVADMLNKLVSSFHNVFPSYSSMFKIMAPFLVPLVVILLMICLLPCIFKTVTRTVTDIYGEIHKIKLSMAAKQKTNTPV
ncbi:hypothetical protein mRhiFer1_008733 [Rhinolophus ferrumequinum]|uniref:Retroviral envelope protein GP41-like domain-containing protein n=1 Tax=Rhinolophus ferrumequinum TaxID=59479 RepID=A0A7J7TQB7_RHIFE|nr:hypothetical protein mRhiFer1_008733 [Rhinolophus ferrumequinum]